MIKAYEPALLGGTAAEQEHSGKHGAQRDRGFREPAAGMQGFSLRQIADYTRAAADRGISWATGR